MTLTVSSRGPALDGARHVHGQGTCRSSVEAVTLVVYDGSETWTVPVGSERSRAEQAKRPFISERTANRHLAASSSSFGVRSRTEGTRIAVAAGLA